MENLDQVIQNLNDKNWNEEEECCIDGAEVLCNMLNSFDDLQVKFKLKAKSFYREGNRIYFGRNHKYQIVIYEDKMAYVARNDGWFGHDSESGHPYSWHKLMTKPEWLKKVILHYINQ